MLLKSLLLLFTQTAKQGSSSMWKRTKKNIKIHLLGTEEWFKELYFNDLIQSLFIFFSPLFFSFPPSSYFLLLKWLVKFQVNIILEKIITSVGA